MSKKKIGRGKLIAKPEMVSGRKMKSKKKKLQYLIGSILVVIVVPSTLIATIMGYWGFEEVPGPEIFNIEVLMLVLAATPLAICLGVIYAIGLEIDAIWEKGISSYYSHTVENIMGRDFLPYDDISKVYYGEHGVYNKEDTEYLVLVKKGENRPYWNGVHFTEKNYDNGFYKKLKKAIKKNAPQAEWIKVDKRLEHARACGKYFKGKEL